MYVILLYKSSMCIHMYIYTCHTYLSIYNLYVYTLYTVIHVLYKTSMCLHVCTVRVSLYNVVCISILYFYFSDL